MRETEREWSPVPYDKERELLKRLREAREARNREEIGRCEKELVRLYVYYGEYFKLSDRPDYRSAKHCLEKALKHEPDHPIANYRYGHLLFREGEYGKAAWHFKRALDGTPDAGLNDSQTLVAQIVLVNCGLQIVRDALPEVRYFQNNKYLNFDHDLVAQYNGRMLDEFGELLRQHMYCVRTSAGTRHVSREEFLEYQGSEEENEVLLVADEGYLVRFRDVGVPLEQQAFYVFWTLISSDDFVRPKEIAAVLLEDGEEFGQRYDKVRQYLHRLRQRIPFWDQVIETKEHGLRRRRDGITYTVLCHSSVVLP